ncbi:MAG: prepilin peptidase [Leptothrix sp. (in: Bacteria)]|jgi:leader peptidase (prepilin peptidase)/N-methyltransferase|nr:prepilin peptidase [Leptothrix sp. (in: b-proteobacteria)]
MDLELQGALAALCHPLGLGLVGLCIGSFLNVVVHRLPRQMERQWWSEVGHQLGDEDSYRQVLAADPPAEQATLSWRLLKALEALPPMGLSRPRSRCPHCSHTIRAHENIPVLSWLLLRGRCSACQASIGLRYPLVEVGCGLLFALIGWRFDAQPVALLWCGFAATLLAASLIDWDTTLLPDSLTLPLLWAGLVAAALGWNLPLEQALWGVVIGYMSLWSVYWFFKLATGKEGMGGGDFKLLAALGAWLGPTMLLPVILGASVLGAIVGLAMKAGGALREGRYVPFGPFLAGAGLVVMLAGSERVLRWMGWA